MSYFEPHIVTQAPARKRTKRTKGWDSRDFPRDLYWCNDETGAGQYERLPNETTCFVCGARLDTANARKDAA